jgi:ParB family chromosome partitioning protein
MTLHVEALDLLEHPTPGAGAPLQLSVDAIDEDPVQPRQEFDPEALAELAATIAERGVRQPVSVRPHPNRAGRWILNFGARRLRASRLAGRTHVPAFVDAAADSYDQVIENEQREALKPLDLALFVKRRLDGGESQAEIARKLGKSKTYVTFIGALIDAPDWLMEVYRQGRCRGAQELYELRRLHAEDPERVTPWLAARPVVSRLDLAELRRMLASAEPIVGAVPDCAVEGDPATSPSAADPGRPIYQGPSPKLAAVISAAKGGPPGPDGSAHEAVASARRLRLTARYRDAEVEVLLDEMPVDRSSVLIRIRQGTPATCVPISSLSHLALSRT